MSSTGKGSIAAYDTMTAPRFTNNFSLPSIGKAEPIATAVIGVALLTIIGLGASERIPMSTVSWSMAAVGPLSMVLGVFRYKATPARKSEQHVRVHVVVEGANASQVRVQEAAPATNNA